MNPLRRIRHLVGGYLRRRFDLPEISTALRRLAKLGFKPDQIFDIGAYRGDFAKQCLSVWPSTAIACFEALEDRVQDLRNLAASEPSIEVFPGLLGAESRTDVPLHVGETASSILSEQGAKALPIRCYPMRSLDEIVLSQSRKVERGFIKMDVQGYELEVLKGAERTLQNGQVLLIETNFLDIYQGVPLVSEVMQWLDQRDWVPFDICGLMRRPLDHVLWQADFIFVPRQSELRADKRWSA